MGYIYIIKNSINNKVYIGQTRYTIENRLRQHKYMSRYRNSKLYNNMRLLGEDNFYIELLDTVDNDDLTKTELKYIGEFNSIIDGYNTNVPIGTRYIHTNLDKELDNMIDDFINGDDAFNIATKYGISHYTLYEIMKLNGITRTKNTYNNYGDSKKKIVMYHKDSFIPICYFESKVQAYNWLKLNSEYKVTKSHAYTYLRQACEKGNIAYGYRWQLFEDLIYNNKVFRTKFEKEAYIGGKEAHRYNDTKYWIVDNILEDMGIIKNKSINNKSNSINLEQEKDNIKRLVEQNIPCERIAFIYGVTSKTVRVWCKKLDIQIGKYSTSGVTCKELDIHFNTFKEASEYLVRNKLTKATHIASIGYNISKAKDNNTKYADLTWI